MVLLLKTTPIYKGTITTGRHCVVAHELKTTPIYKGTITMPTISWRALSIKDYPDL